MPTNNFKLFDEKKANMMTDEDYAINQQRLNGVQSGVASSQLQNKTLYQTALMCYALAQLMAANGYDANDADAVSTFVNNMSASMVQKVVDRATESEASSGVLDSKYISPKTLKVVKPIYGENDPTTNTIGFLGQIYINKKTMRSFVCVATSSGSYSWEKIPVYEKVVKTEIITESSEWTVPSGIVGDIFVRIFGAGAGGGGHMATGNYSIAEGTKVNITIGAGAAYTGNGGASSFGSYLTAQGATGLNGGTGGGGSQARSGGNGSYGGGGGAGGAYGDNGKAGGSGGTYGGGGGGSAGGLYGSGGSGGSYGGNGGRSGSSGSAGTNTVGMGLEFEGEGKGGSALGTDGSYYGGGGGGGYGGNGGNGGGNGGAASSGGGGGGYGGNGGKGGTSLGSSYMSGGGGGGGYGSDGGDGGDGNYTYGSGVGGGGGGYGPSGKGGSGLVTESVKFAAGGGKGTGGNGVCVLSYTILEVK